VAKLMLERFNEFRVAYVFALIVFPRPEIGFGTTFAVIFDHFDAVEIQCEGGTGIAGGAEKGLPRGGISRGDMAVEVFLERLEASLQRGDLLGRKRLRIKRGRTKAGEEGKKK